MMRRGFFHFPALDSDPVQPYFSHKTQARNMATISKIRAEFDARQATEAMYALSERARFLNKLLAEQRKRWEEANDPKVKDAIDSSIKRLEAEVAAVEKLNNSIQKSINTESAFQQVLEGKTSSMSQARLTSAQRNAQAIMRNINPQDENAIDQMDEAQRVMNAAGKQIASLKNGFMDAMRTVEDGVEGKALPELKRLEAALTEAQKFSTDQGEWQKYEEAISKVRLEMQQASIVAIELEEKNGKAAASLKYGFEDAFQTFEGGIEGMALPQLKRLEAALTESQKFSVDAEEWQKFGAAIDTVRQKIQGITGEYLSIGDAMKYGEQIEKQTFTGTIADLERAKKLLTDYRKTIKQTADGGAELKKIDDNLEIIDQQIKGTYLTTQKFNEILNHPKGKSFDELKAAIERAETQLYGMRRETDEEREAFVRLHEQIEAAKEELKDFGEAQDDAGDGMDSLIEKAKGLAGAYLSLQGLQKVWELNVGMSDAMADVRKTTGMAADEVENLLQRIKEIDTRTANEQLLALSATAGQLGLSAEEDVLGFTKAANQVTTALDELGNEGVLELMKVAQVSGALEKEGGNVEKTLLKVGSAINELSAASSATAGPITDFIGRVGGVASTVKMSMSEIAALGATTDQLAISAELAGTQMNVFLSGMQKHTDAVANLLGVSRDSVQAMLDQGDAMGVLMDVLEKMQTLNAVEMSDFLKEMGSSGGRATQVFATLSQNVDALRENLIVSNQAYREGTSITDEYTQRNESAAGMIERLKNELTEVFVQPAIINGIRGMVSVAKGFLEIWSNPFVAPALNAITVFLASSFLGVNKLALAVKNLRNKIVEAGSATKVFAGAFKSFWSANWPSIILGVGTAIVTMLTEWYNHAKQVRMENANLIRTLDKEKEAVDKLFKPLQDHNTLQRERRNLIKQINDKYGSYLANMLSEKSTAFDIAQAYALINQQLKEKSILEGMEANRKKVTEERKEDLDQYFSEMDTYISRASSNDKDAARVSRDVNAIITKGIEEGLSRADISSKVNALLSGLVDSGQLRKSILQHNFAVGPGGSQYEQSATVIGGAAMRYYDKQVKVQEEINKTNRRLQADLDVVREDITQQLAPRVQQVLDNFKTGSEPQGKKNPETFTPEESQAAINAYKAMRDFYVQHREHMTEEVRKQYEKNIESFDVVTHEKNAAAATASTDAVLTGGIDQRSTDYLKQRKKDLQKMADLLEDGFDVTLLHYDKEFQKTGIETVDAARDWFNGQMQQIQAVLDARRKATRPDKPTKVSVASSQPESDAAVANLDRYYEGRKAQLEIERSKELITEGEFERHMEQTEQEHLQRRAQLRQSFTKDMTEAETQQFREWWDSVKELGNVEWSKIEKEWSKHATPDDIAKNNLAAARDLTQMQAIIVKQLKEIETIIDKERPFNGITTNLQNNLTKMGLLFKDGVPEGDKFMEENTRRLTFLLREAENAYAMTWEQLEQDMRQNGLGSWADAITGSENAEKEKRAIIAQLHEVYDAVQEAIKKEASLVKKQVDIQWNDAILPNGKSTKATYEAAISALGVQQGSVSRANSLIGAGAASERVADRLAIRQMQVQLRMQEHYYNLVRQTGQRRVDDLLRAAEEQRKLNNIAAAEKLELDAKHAQMSLNLSLSKEETELAKQREEIIARTEESQNRLYTELKEWGDLLASSLQSIFEASAVGNAEYYNELAKLNLTGKGGPGAGTYVVIDDAGTEDATAHYEYLDERQALERQHEIEQENAKAEAWKKVMDDINAKLSETITDQLNALFQNASLDVNTQALDSNTDAVTGLTGAVNNLSGTIAAKAAQDAAYRQGGNGQTINGGNMGVDENGVPIALKMPEATEGTQGYGAPWMQPTQTEGTSQPSPLAPPHVDVEAYTSPWAAYAQANTDATKTVMENDKKAVKSSKQSFAAMTAAANMYGIAYQTMSNENLSTSQKVWMMIVQAAGQAMISMLTASLAADTGETASHAPAWISKTLKELGPVGGPVAVGVFTALIGGLMATAVSKIGKSKSEIAQATGSGGASAGKLATGMLTYAEGNVNEFTDPASLTPGRRYNVDAADGKTYRARYMGSNPRTHITNGPEFHLAGEAGREMIIDAGTTRQITMNEGEIWHAIQTLSNGGRGYSLRRSAGHGGMRAFADGNVEEFEDYGANGANGANGAYGGMTADQLLAFQASLDRNSAIMERLAEEGIEAFVSPYGKRGIVNGYDHYKKEAQRQGVKY